MVTRQQRSEAPAALPKGTIPQSTSWKASQLAENLELGPNNQVHVLKVLRHNDQQWLPRLVQLPNGTVRYKYKRRSGEPTKTLNQLKEITKNPPSHDQEQQAIKQLLYELNRAGATVVIAPPKQASAAGEWNPRRGELRIRQSVVRQGTIDFAKVLNHEAIHTAQSCAGGSIRSQPKPLGISRAISAKDKRKLNQSLYSDINLKQRVLEEEAYANQGDLKAGRNLLIEHCI